MYQIQISEKKKNEKFRQDIYANMEQDKEEVFSFISAQFADLKNYIDVKFASFSSSQEIVHVSKKPRLSNGEEMTETQVTQGVHRELKDPPKPTGISDWSKVVSPSLDKELELFLFHWHLYDTENLYARTVPKKATVNKKTGKTYVCISAGNKNKKKRMVTFFCALTMNLPLDSHGHPQAIKAIPSVPEEYISWVRVTKGILCKAFENVCVYVAYEERMFPKMNTIVDLFDAKKK